MQVVALWVSRKPNKEYDLPMTGSQEVLFWHERAKISLQFFINLIPQKVLQNPGESYLGMNTGNIKRSAKKTSQWLLFQWNHLRRFLSWAF